MSTSTVISLPLASRYVAVSPTRVLDTRKGVGAPVAMGFVETQYSAPGTPLEAEVRGKRQPMRVSALPFVPHRYVRTPAR